MAGIGVDVGTSYLVAARQGEGNKIIYSDFRDAFFRISPSTPIAAKMIEKGLEGKKYFKDSNGDFVVTGQDAIDKAVERHSSAQRPLSKGVISPTEKDAIPVLKFMLKDLVGSPRVENESLVYSIPAQPIDQIADHFDTAYHEDVLGNFFKELGYNAKALNEGEAIAYSELMDEGLTGVVCGFGAGMCQLVVMSNGEAVLRSSTTRSGDFVDRMVATATNQPDTVIQMEKEAGGFDIMKDDSDNQIHKALVVYYRRLIEYSAKVLANQLQKTGQLPKFNQAIPIVIAGGTSLAKGFSVYFKHVLKDMELPFEVSTVRLAREQLKSVARGCLLGAEIL